MWFQSTCNVGGKMNWKLLNTTGTTVRSGLLLSQSVAVHDSLLWNVSSLICTTALQFSECNDWITFGLNMCLIQSHFRNKKMETKKLPFIRQVCKKSEIIIVFVTCWIQSKLDYADHQVNIWFSDTSPFFLNEQWAGLPRSGLSFLNLCYGHLPAVLHFLSCKGSVLWVFAFGHLNSSLFSLLGLRITLKASIWLCRPSLMSSYIKCTMLDWV